MLVEHVDTCVEHVDTLGHLSLWEDPRLWKLTTSLRSHQQNLQDTMALRPLLQRYFTHQNPLIFPESRGLHSLF